MASTKRKTIHLFNCDNLCSLSEVESLLTAVEKNVAFKISKIEKHQFSGSQITDVAEKTIPNLRGLDFAVFVVHAHECRLSFNEDSGYGKIYTALKKRAGSDENVLIIVGEDNNYKDDYEQERRFLSRWAEKAICHQFRAELIDGRKSFIFSWNKKHRPIHEEALLHYFDPSKKGERFNYVPKPKRPPEMEEPGIDPPAALDIEQEKCLRRKQHREIHEEALLHYFDPNKSGQKFESKPKATSSIQFNIVDATETSEIYKIEFVDEMENDKQNPVAADVIGQEHPEEASGAEVSTTGSHLGYPDGSVLLETQRRYGKISYEANDVKKREHGWQPPEEVKERLEQKYSSTPDATVSLVALENEIVERVTIPLPWNYCLIL
ncbi:hypothetical protein ACROYT_G027460 [Oculina patagonica]